MEIAYLRKFVIVQWDYEAFPFLNAHWPEYAWIASNTMTIGWLSSVEIFLHVEINKSPSDLQCSDLFCVIVTGEAFLKLISLQSVSWLFMCEKRDLKESD
jgi:hypothetical protein